MHNTTSTSVNPVLFCSVPFNSRKSFHIFSMLCLTPSSSHSIHSFFALSSLPYPVVSFKAAADCPQEVHCLSVTVVGVSHHPLARSHSQQWSSVSAGENRGHDAFTMILLTSSPLLISRAARCYQASLPHEYSASVSIYD